MLKEEAAQKKKEMEEVAAALRKNHAMRVNQLDK